MGRKGDKNGSGADVPESKPSKIPTGGVGFAVGIRNDKMASMAHNRSVLKEQIPRYIPGKDGAEFVRTYPEYVLTDRNVHLIMPVYVDAGLKLADIQCSSPFYPEVTNLEQLKQSAGKKQFKPKIQPPDALTVTLTPAQFNHLKDHYTGLARGGAKDTAR